MEEGPEVNQGGRDEVLGEPTQDSRDGVNGDKTDSDRGVERAGVKEIDIFPLLL